MSSKRKLFTYDSIEDADIDQFFESLPQRQASKYIRMGLRLIIKELENKELESTSRTLKKEIQPNKEKSNNEIEKDDFIDPQDDILNLGK